MSFRLVPKSVTFNDSERQNGGYIALFHCNNSILNPATFMVSGGTVHCRHPTFWDPLFIVFSIQ